MADRCIINIFQIFNCVNSIRDKMANPELNIEIRTNPVQYFYLF